MHRTATEGDRMDAASCTASRQAVDAHVALLSRIGPKQGCVMERAVTDGNASALCMHCTTLSTMSAHEGGGTTARADHTQDKASCSKVFLGFLLQAINRTSVNERVCVRHHDAPNGKKSTHVYYVGDTA